MDKEKFMKEALKEAGKAYQKEEIPVGAIIVKDGKIIARAHNLKETKQTALAHAEILAIKKATQKLNTWRLLDCEMYITLEPCTMCMGAIILSRLKKIYIGTLDEKTGACGSFINLQEYKYNHTVEVETGILKDKCEYILKDFFKNLRKNKRRKKMLKSTLKRRGVGIYISIVILALIAIIIAFIMYKYHVEGENNMPFSVSEFLVVSTAQTTETIINEENYESNIIQKNDVYISLEKNPEYKDEENIKKISFSNFKITKINEKGTMNIYRPAMSEKTYEYSENYIVTDGFEYAGDKLTDTKGEVLTIGNQGGVINFSIATTDLGILNYPKDENLSADGRLLNRIGINLEDIQAEVSFDMTIELESGRSFKSNIILEIPTGDILTEGVSKQDVDGEKLVFKR